MTGPMRTPRPGEQSAGPTPAPQLDRAVRDTEAGSLGETVASAGAVILGILGIVGLLPGVLDSVAAIAAGLAILIGSIALGGRVSRLLGERSHAEREVSSGLGLSAMAGVAGIVLGILALLGVSRVALVSIAAITFGAGLLISSAAMVAFERMLRTEHGTDAVYLASGAEGLVGLAAIVLGILALDGLAPITLSLIAMLGVGAAALMSGTSVASQFMTLRR